MRIWSFRRTDTYLVRAGNRVARKMVTTPTELHRLQYTKVGQDRQRSAQSSSRVSHYINHTEYDSSQHMNCQWRHVSSHLFYAQAALCNNTSVQTRAVSTLRQHGVHYRFHERYFRQNGNCSSSGLVQPSKTQGHQKWMGVWQSALPQCNMGLV